MYHLTIFSRIQFLGFSLDTNFLRCHYFKNIFKNWVVARVRLLLGETQIKTNREASLDLLTGKPVCSATFQIRLSSTSLL